MSLPLGFLSPPLQFARKVVNDYATTKWDGSVLRKNELPPELLEKPELVLIYLLPRIFRKLGKPFAAQFNEIWQYGPRRFQGLRYDRSLGASKYHWIFSWDQFSRASPALNSVVRELLADDVSAFSRLQSEQGPLEPRWKELRNYVNRIKAAKRGKRGWIVTTVDYRSTITYPEIPLTQLQMDTSMYWRRNEDPIRSDAYAAIGPCAVRTYVSASFRKDEGSDDVFMLPKRIGVRIWDDYNFGDSASDRLQGILLSGELSQFLGNWYDKRTGANIALHNSDFREYKSWFEPRFNSYIRRLGASPSEMLNCTDYHPISTYSEKTLSGEYKLPGSW